MHPLAYVENGLTMFIPQGAPWGHDNYSEILDHLGLVAGMFDELAIGEVIDRATQQHPEQ